MKKRLRKKRRLGEFREDCFEVHFEVAPSLETQQVEQLTDDFIAMIESHQLQFGGEVDRTWHGIVQGSWRKTTTPEDRQRVIEWMETHELIVNAWAGPLRDAWYGWD